MKTTRKLINFESDDELKMLLKQASQILDLDMSKFIRRTMRREAKAVLQKS